ncbi:MAG: ATPase, partial [Shinella zoogloeoides]
PEPYRPDMLPGAGSVYEPSPQERFDAIRRELAEPQRPAADPYRQPQRPAFGEQQEPRREGSIREQLLKKPLSSLIRR